MRHREILIAIIVQIAGHDKRILDFNSRNCWIRSSRELAVRSRQHDRDGRTDSIDRGNIWPTVVVKVGDGRADRRYLWGEGSCRTQVAILLTRRQGYFVGPKDRDCQVANSVAVEIAHNNPDRPSPRRVSHWLRKIAFVVSS